MQSILQNVFHHAFDQSCIIVSNRVAFEPHAHTCCSNIRVHTKIHGPSFNTNHYSASIHKHKYSLVTTVTKESSRKIRKLGF